MGLGWDQRSLRNIGSESPADPCRGGLSSAPALLFGAATVQPDPEYPANCPSFRLSHVPADLRRIWGRNAVPRLCFSDAGRMGRARSPLCCRPACCSLLPTPGTRTSRGSGLINTFGFGLVLGYAYLRSRDLWLPIGIHFGWNWALVVFGLNVSGFKMGVTGFVVRWQRLRPLEWRRIRPGGERADMRHHRRAALRCSTGRPFSRRKPEEVRDVCLLSAPPVDLFFPLLACSRRSSHRTNVSRFFAACCPSMPPQRRLLPEIEEASAVQEHWPVRQRRMGGSSASSSVLPPGQAISFRSRRSISTTTRSFSKSTAA